MKTLLKPPSCYIHCLLENKELVCLLNSLTQYYSQTNPIYHAELIISNKEWAPIKYDGVTYGHKRKDTNISLDGLNCVDIHADKIIFKYDKGDDVTVPVTDDFFYYMEWEDDYYG